MAMQKCRRRTQAEVVSIEDGVSRVTNWILGPGETLLNARQNVGYDVSSAEDLKRNHESLELRCREPYSRYAEILRKLDVLARSGTKFSEDLRSQKDFMDFVCRSFASRVERRRNILITSARFFRLVSEYFQVTSAVYENVMMSVDVEQVESAENDLEELLKRVKSIDTLERELVGEGEKLSDLLSMPVKDAFGRELPVDYRDDIANVREILEMTIARKQLFKDSVELHALTLRQLVHIRNYEKTAVQAIKWLNELYAVLMKSHSHIGSTVCEILSQKEEHERFQETAKGTFEFACQLLQAALALRQSCKLSELHNTQFTLDMWHSWKRLHRVSQEQLTRLRVSAVFHRNVDKYIGQLRKLTEDFIISVVDEETDEKRIRLRNILRRREYILLEVGRTIRLGRLLKSRLREPLHDDNNCAGSKVDIVEKNETAIIAICEKLSEVTILAEQLDTTLCGFKFAMESDSIKKLLEINDSACQSWKDSSESGSRSDGNKSDDDLVTASECTGSGTSPSRASSFHTASEGESASPWWDTEASSSPENGVATAKFDRPNAQRLEKATQAVRGGVEASATRTIASRPGAAENCAATTDEHWGNDYRSAPPSDRSPQKWKEQSPSPSPSPSVSSRASPANRVRWAGRCGQQYRELADYEDRIQRLKQKVDSVVANAQRAQGETEHRHRQRPRQQPQPPADPTASGFHNKNKNAAATASSLRCHRRFVKQAITGIF